MMDIGDKVIIPYKKEELEWTIHAIEEYEDYQYAVITKRGKYYQIWHYNKEDLWEK